MRVPTSLKVGRAFSHGASRFVAGATLTPSEVRAFGSRVRVLLGRGYLVADPDPWFRRAVTNRRRPTYLPPSVFHLLVNAGPSVEATVNMTDLDLAGIVTVTDAEGDLYVVGWNFGDTVTAAGRAVTHTYDRPGSYTVTITATDAHGKATTITETVEAVAPNVAPVAGFTATPTLLSVAFADTSTDSDGTIASYSWDFGDESEAVTTASPTHVYAQAGTYTVSLTVTDDDGLTDTATDEVTVSAE